MSTKMMTVYGTTSLMLRKQNPTLEAQISQVTLNLTGLTLQLANLHQNEHFLPIAELAAVDLLRAGQMMDLYTRMAGVDVTDNDEVVEELLRRIEVQSSWEPYVPSPIEAILEKG